MKILTAFFIPSVNSYVSFFNMNNLLDEVTTVAGVTQMFLINRFEDCIKYILL